MEKHLSRWVSIASLLAAGCGDVTAPAAAHVIPGGGIADGKIVGTLYVNVTDGSVHFLEAVLQGATAEPEQSRGARAVARRCRSS